MLSNLFGSDSKINEVQTSQLKVRGKTLVFGDTVYSIPNLSVIAVGEIKRPPPVLGYLLILAGFLLLASDSATYGLICLIIGGALVYWHFTNKKHGLRLVTNSGESAVIVSADLEFLRVVAVALFNLMNSESFRDLNINLDQRQIIEVGSMEGSQFVAGSVHGELVNNI